MLGRAGIALVATLAASCAVMSRGTLFGSDPSYGSAQARLVQRALNEHGYRVEPTGSYDDRTRAAVAAFQRSHGMKESGEMDAATASALGLRPSEVAPTRDEDSIQDEIQYHAWHDPL